MTDGTTPEVQKRDVSIDMENDDIKLQRLMEILNSDSASCKPVKGNQSGLRSRCMSVKPTRHMGPQGTSERSCTKVNTTYLSGQYTLQLQFMNLNVNPQLDWLVSMNIEKLMKYIARKTRRVRLSIDTFSKSMGKLVL